MMLFSRTLHLMTIPADEVVPIFGHGSIDVNSGSIKVWIPPPSVPARPAGLAAVGGAGQVSLSWSVIGGLIYNLYWSLAPGVTPLNGTRIASVSEPYIHTGRDSSTEYFYVLTAVNDAGESAPSAEVNATTSVVFKMINPDLGEYVHTYQTTMDLGQYSHSICGTGTLGETDLGEYVRVIHQPGTLGQTDLREAP